jgi:hypothetical protein
MNDRIGFFSQLWRKAKDSIAQPVPTDVQFCEFQCPHRLCLLDTTGRCDIRPQQSLVFLQVAQANAATWGTGTATGTGTPARVA